MDDKIRVVFLIAEKFPEPIGSFILDQITGVIDEDVEVGIFVVGSRQEIDHNLEKLENYEIYEKTHYLNIPDNKIIRILKAIPLLIKNPFIAFKLMNYKKYGKMALTLIPLYAYHGIKNSKIKFDLMHSHFGPMGLAGLGLKDTKLVKKLLTSFHGGDVNGYPLKAGKNVYIPLFERGDFFTVNSKFTGEKIKELGCKNGEKVSVIPMIIDDEKFYPSRSKERNQKLKILTVGRLMEEKGHEFVIRAVAKLINKEKIKDIEYTIVGDGPLEDKLKMLVKKNKIEDSVKFLGRKTGESLLKEFQSSDIFVLTSIPASYGSGEGQGVSVQEAQLVELPIITSDFAGLPEGMCPGKSGLLSPIKDVDSIAKNIKTLKENIKIRQMMGKKGRKFVKKKFGKKQLSEKLVAIYRKLV